MKIAEFYKELTEFAPLELSEKLCFKDGLTDNSGYIITPKENEELKGVAFMLDLTIEGAKYAVKNGCNLIVTHHPAIFSPIKRIETSSPLSFCVLNGVSVASMHLNFDCAKRGIDFWFSKGLGGDNQLIDEDFGDNTGYGRLFKIEKKTAEEVVQGYKKAFNTERVFLYGDKNREITKIASFCGAGLDERAVEVAVCFGAEMVASADIKHHVLLYALEKGLSVLSCTHYATENYGMKKVFGIFADKLKNEKIIFFDDERLS